MPGGFGAADVAELERAIQQAIAPAFLLTGIFGLLNVLAGRLARVIDRERSIRNGLSPPPCLGSGDACRSGRVARITSSPAAWWRPSCSAR